jgi:phosphoribosyl 1,2-cyclic phosphate phosphodiesterase
MDARDQRLRCSSLLEFSDPSGKDRSILIDAGPDLRQQALRYRMKRCDAVLVTHNHVDHVWGIDELRRFNAIQQEAIPLYADEHTMESLRRVYTHIFDRHNNVNDSFVASLIPWTITQGDLQTGRVFEILGLRITPMRILHGKAPILGYRIDAGAGMDSSSSRLLPLAYLTDVSGIPPETWPLLEGLQTLIIDALRHRRHPTHFTLGEAISVSSRVESARTYFIHMSHDLPHAQTQAELPEGMFLAYDGLVLE